MRNCLVIWLALCLLHCTPAVEITGVESAPQIPEEDPYLIVLGVAQDAGYPQAGCNKSCCRDSWRHPDQHRHVSSVGIVDPATDQRWMIDATPDFKEQLYQLTGYPASDTARPPDGIFLTHAHMGHYTGLMHLGREAMGTSNVPVYALPRMQKFLLNNGPWDQLCKLNNIRIQPMTAYSKVELSKGLQISPLLVPHRDEYSETCGYIIETARRRVLFIPDIDKWHKWERDINQLLGEVDIALLDGTFYADGEIPGRDMSEIPHPFIEESMKRFGKLPDSIKSRIYFTHFNHTNPALKSNSEARKIILKKGFRLAEQGQIIRLD